MKHYNLFILFIPVTLWLTACGASTTPTPAQVACTPPALQENIVEEAIAAGAVVVYERTGEATCINEVWIIHPDGRIMGDNGHTTVEETVTPGEISTLLTEIDELGFFDLLSTEHTACRDCFSYRITVSHDGQRETVSAVDGGTDTPGEYWKVYAKIKRLLPDFPEE